MPSFCAAGDTRLQKLVWLKLGGRDTLSERNEAEENKKGGGGGGRKKKKRSIFRLERTIAVVLIKVLTTLQTLENAWTNSALEDKEGGKSGLEPGNEGITTLKKKGCQ